MSDSAVGTELGFSPKAFLSIQVPRETNLRYGRERAPILLETETGDVSLELRANGRPAPVPSGVVYLTLEPGTAQERVVGMNLEAGKRYNYQFSRRGLVSPAAERFCVSSTRAVGGRSGSLFIRILEGPMRKAVARTYFVGRTEDGGLSFIFEVPPVPPVLAEIMVPGHSRTLLALAMKPGPGRLQSTARLTFETMDRREP
jgi:hypothetical protein